jgi:hypothetical protein
VAEIRYDRDITALLVVDPYNDFISEGGKIWDRIRAVAEANDCVPHMLQKPAHNLHTSGLMHRSKARLLDHLVGALLEE